MKRYLALAAGLLVTAGAVCAQNVPDDTHHTDNRPDNEYNVIANATAAGGSSAYAEQYKQALDDYKAGRLDQAARGLESVVKKAPDNVTAHSLLGYIYLRQDKNAPAVAEMEKVIKLAPKEDDAHKNLAGAYLRAGRYDDAAAQYKIVLAHSPRDAGSLFGLAMAQGQAGRNDDAVASFRQAIAVRPTSVAYQNLGVVLQKSGRNLEAADAFRKAADLDPKNAGAWLYAGLLYSQVGANDKAIPALTQALALGTPSLYDAHMALAQAYAGQKNNPKAMAEFAAAVKARPDDPTAHFDLAVLQTQAGQKADAEQSYRKVLDLKPTDPQIVTQAQTNLGLLLAADGNATEAVPLLSAATQADPKAAAPHLALANLYAKQGDAAKALAERQAALALTPQDDQTRLLVADALLAQKQYAEAAAQYAAVAGRQPTNAAVQNALGTAYEQTGDLARAQAAFEAALAANPRYAQAQNNLGVVYEKQGKKAQALAAYKKAVAIDPTLTEAKRNLARYTAK